MSILLVSATFSLYWPAWKFGFVYDDLAHILGDSSLSLGLTKEGIEWAFTSFHSANWYPLTLISHLLDVQIFDLHAGPPHAVNMLLHAINTVLLFALLRDLTGATMYGALVAALFALHPLHVESVAWISERKGLLCALFWILAMRAYVRYLRNRSISRYLLVLLSSAAAMMSKPMAVTLPFTLLLLDYWPLGRLRLEQSTNAGRSPLLRVETLTSAALEKAPLLFLAGASSVVTYVAQHSAGAIGLTTIYPLPLRIGNALLSYGNYLIKTLWPRDLAALYLFPLDGMQATEVVFAGIAIGGITLVCIGLVRRLPYLATGWFWFLGTLVPAMGFVQVGMQSMADRYTYIPHIGLFCAIVWGFFSIAQDRSYGSRRLMGSGVVLVLAVLFMVSREQLPVWKSNRTLYDQMMKVDPNNWVAQTELGLLLTEEGNAKEGIAWYRASLRVKPDYPTTHYNLAVALQAIGRLDEAEAHYRTAVDLNATLAEAWHNLGTIAWVKNRKAEAAAHFLRAIRLKPDFAEAHHSLGVASLERPDPEQATQYFERAAELDPRNETFLQDLSRARVEVERQKHFRRR